MSYAAIIRWPVSPFRGDKFQQTWMPAAEAALDFGATYWALYRSLEGRLDFVQVAHFPEKGDFDRYWYSEEISKAREQITGWFAVPLLPAVFELAGDGAARPAAAPATAEPSS